MDFWNQSKHQPLSEQQTKRISTPAGQRLSVILENGNSQAKTRDSHRASMRKSGLASALIGDVPQENSEEQSNNSYTYSVWSDGEKFAALRNHQQIAKRGGWRRIAMIAVGVLVLIIALAVGLAVGLKKKPSNSNDNDAPAAAAAAATQTSNPSSPTGTSSPGTSSLPTNFPVGSYSFVTFLDTPQTNCTSIPSTWACYPYIEYNTDHTKSAATFNWIISGSAPNLQISSTSNPFSINFKNVALKLDKQGQDDESYRFQLQLQKTVTPTASLTKDNAAIDCDYADTSFTAWLYTKKAKTYPDTAHGDGDGSPAFAVWPFGIKIEQVAAGNPGVPSCHTKAAPQTPLTDLTVAQDNGQLCSCLYRNWKASLPT